MSVTYEESRQPALEDPRVMWMIETSPGHRVTVICRRSEVPRFCDHYGAPLPPGFADTQPADEQRP